MTNHTFLIRIGNGALFQRVHVGKRLLHARLHGGEERVIHVHAAQIDGQSEFGKLAIVFLEAFPPLRFGVFHKESRMK